MQMYIHDVEALEAGDIRQLESNKSYSRDLVVRWRGRSGRNSGEVRLCVFADDPRKLLLPSEVPVDGIAEVPIVRQSGNGQLAAS